MAYQVETGSRRFVGSGGVVLVHVTLAYLLVFGLAPPPFISPKVPPLSGEQIPLPEDPPKPDPKPKAQAPTSREQAFDRLPDKPIFPESRLKLDVEPLDPVGKGTFDYGGAIDFGQRGLDPVLFTPSPASPRNDVARWVTTAEYPPGAIRRSEQGVTGFNLKIDALGNVTDCTVTRTSGSRLLDETTCKYVRRRARFDPATDKNGAKVPGSYSNSVSWVLPE